MLNVSRFVVAILLLCSHVAMAHSGHDHSSPWAALIHLAWLAPIAIAAWLVFKKRHLLKSRINQIER